jgi:cell division septation protein DedD/nucleoid DNA-binding protein
MTKAELIRKVAKNVGVPDTDAKIFFELFLKRICAIVEIGQSIFVKDFGYFHLIKGSIKKPVFSFKDNEISEEAVELVLFSEDKDLRKSDTKGLVFNIPFFDEDDYHPIDSTFSLSIGKPLIPLRGVPFDNIYMPTSGYEYRRLIESKVEKIIASSEVAESEENFPTLVIDARSYNSNQVQLQWDDKSNIDSVDQSKIGDETGPEVKPELSEYEKQTKELKNIAWDFGEGLSQQIEVESILDIADERISMDTSIKQKLIADDEPSKTEGEITDTNMDQENLIVDPEIVEDIVLDQSSEKLNELLESENEPTEIFEEKILEQNLIDSYEDHTLQIENTDTAEIEDELNEEIIIENSPEPMEADIEENTPIEGDLTDEDFWKSSSKYFEPYKPLKEKINEGENPEENVEIANSGLDDSDESDQAMDEDIRDVIENEIILDVDSSSEESNTEIKNEIQENIMDENIEEDKIELEQSSEQQAEYFEPTKKKNLIPFIIFPLLVIGLSVALYWYLEFYKKNEITPKPIQVTLKTDNAKIVQRNFDIPVTYPYLQKVKETTISETIDSKNEVENATPEKTEIIKDEQVKFEEKKVEKEIPKQLISETKEPVKQVIPTGTSLNVGNNIYKYGNYFVVQVAAFRSSSISENEAGKYRNKGYNAFVEAAEIPERGTWYRVRVGNFSTKEEAQDFIKKNIR